MVRQEEEHDDSPTSTSTPFYSIRGYPSCPWYRQALCIAQEFIDQQSSSSSTSSASPVQIEVHSMTPIQYSQHLHTLNQSIDLHQHNTCPIILQGSCHATDTNYHPNDKDDKSILSHCNIDSLVGGYNDLSRLLYERYGFTSQRCKIENIRKGTDRC